MFVLKIADVAAILGAVDDWWVSARRGVMVWDLQEWFRHWMALSVDLLLVLTRPCGPARLLSEPIEARWSQQAGNWITRGVAFGGKK